MGYPQKIVTCCYCGSRAALVLSGTVRHELSCASCGAPLHSLKMLPADRSGARDLVEPRRPLKRGKSGQPSRSPKRSGKMRRKTRLLKDLVEEAFDLLEDIFD